MKIKITLIAFFATLMLQSSAQDYKLVWEDNFDGEKLDTKTWSVESEVGIWNTGSNSELQHYKHENVEVGDDGDGNNCLIITAKKEEYNGYGFTSGKIESKGKFTFKFGKMEARIKIPDLKNGLWPAFWTIGHKDMGWPQCGEIDILEMGHADGIAASTQNKHHSGALHWEHADNYAGYGRAEESEVDLNNDFHLFTLIWTETTVQMFLDDNTEPYYIMGISGDDLEEFKEYQMFLIFNLAVGGQFPGIYDAADLTAPLPAKMYVDYVKLYQLEGKEDFTTTAPVIGNFGAYAETSSNYQKLDFNFDGEIETSNLTKNNNETPKEGTQVLAYNTIANEEFTLKVRSISSLNMTNQSEGGISLYIKTNISEDIQIGIADTDGNSSFVLLSESGSFNPSRDDVWSRITLPMEHFAGSVDLTKIKDFLIVKGSSANSSKLSIDNVIWMESILSADYLGIFTENTNITENVIIGENSVSLYIWENSLATLDNVTPFEGAGTLAFSDNGMGWYGFGIFSENGIDATAFQNGYLIFTLKTKSNSNFWIGIGGTNQTEGKIVFNKGTDPYNFERNGEYQTLVIPISDFNDNCIATIEKDLDLSACGNILMFGGDSGLTEISIDDVYLSKTETPLENPLILELTTLQISPKNKTIAIGESIQLYAKGLDQFDGTIDIEPEWSSDNDGFITEAGEFVGVTVGTFSITAKYEDIMGTTSVEVIEATSAKQNSNTTFMVYPNPAHNQITFESKEPIASIQIFDVTGKLVHSQNCLFELKTTMQVGDLTKGIYIANILLKGGNTMLNKFILN
ncbi:MAG: family 16 glycosylhydrolase [Salinivirgaceae bacterium]|jgi:beta-glucanase (GH16 family)|nr:family 16 glycosylhydrolase [Salinivirgaceae bacterium]